MKKINTSPRRPTRVRSDDKPLYGQGNSMLHPTGTKIRQRGYPGARIWWTLHGLVVGRPFEDGREEEGRRRRRLSAFLGSDIP